MVKLLFGLGNVLKVTRPSALTLSELNSKEQGFAKYITARYRCFRTFWTPLRKQTFLNLIFSFK